ncbi:MAG TPA: hypothetical protein VF629_20885 [Hymenobacter sp.]|jgi:hypothetical protein|uniref:TolB family protein n=1 Tax=Hymenobacter sp. TaxID=1898978 RepID=UPI002ED7A833
MRRLLLCGLLGLFGWAPARAQSLSVLDQNPPALRWQQVRTPHFRVLYSGGIDSAAQRTAARLEQLHGPGVATLGVNSRPIGVVLQSQTTIPNGFVTFLPRHAEFFTTPQQGMGLGTVDWLDGLAVHEYRHVGQFEKARQGIGRVLGPLLGDGALGVAAVGVPQWFFEGDAVGTETALTRSGRGRIPSFGVGLRANLLAGRRYGYQKANNGSLRDNVPDWYVLGYFLTSYLKTHHGPDAWAKALDQYYRFPFYPFSFSRGIKRTTGLRVEALYDRTMAELDSAWRAQQRELPPLTPARELAAQASEKVFTEYRYPQYVTDSTVLALKTGLGHIAQWVLLSRRAPERKVFVAGLLNQSEMASVAGGRAVWPEFRQHPRWGQQVYSELKVLDLATGKLRRVGQGSRYSAAALSPDGQRLVAVQTDASYRHSLVLLNATTGAVEQTLPNPANDLYQQPRWHPDGRRLVAVTLSAAGKTIVVIDPTTGTADALLPVANVNLTNPQPWGDHVLYNSPQSGIDNIYAVNIATRQTYRVTNRPLGAYHAAIAPDGRSLAFHDFRATGARVVEMPLDPATWQPVPVATAEAPAIYAAQLTAQEPAGRAMAQRLAAPDSARPRYGVRRYSPLAHAFNVFSYGVVQSPVGNSVSVGVRSQDLLSTTQIFAGLNYDQSERTVSGIGAFSYQGFFPVLDVEAEYGGRDVALYVDRRRPLDSLVRDQWRYTRFRAGVRLPFTLTRSKYLQALTLGSHFLREQVWDYDLPVRRRSEVGPNSPLNAVQTSLTYVAQLKMSARDVAPRGGGNLLATWRTTPFGTGLEAEQWAMQASAFLPGIGRHHAVRLRGGYQWQDQAQYQFQQGVSYPRGEGYTSFDRFQAASADYYLPIAYTHWTLGRWLYVQRLRATAFVDVAQGRTGLARVNYRNFGGDVSALFNVLRLRTPVEAGVRVVYSSNSQQWLLEPLAFSIRL